MANRKDLLQELISLGKKFSTASTSLTKENLVCIQRSVTIGS